MTEDFEKSAARRRELTRSAMVGVLQSSARMKSQPSPPGRVEDFWVLGTLK